MNAPTENIGRLLFGLTKNWRAVLDTRLAPLGLSEARWHCLLHLGRADAALPQVELADRMGISPATLVRLLDRLEEDGLVERHPEPQDRRAKRVELTAKARDLASRVETEARQLRAELYTALSQDEQAALERTLMRLQERLDEVRRQTPSAEASHEPARHAS
jgi:MarR family transcriptional regulator for hemolysin